MKIKPTKLEGGVRWCNEDCPINSPIHCDSASLLRKTAICLPWLRAMVGAVDAKRNLQDEDICGPAAVVLDRKVRSLLHDEEVEI